MTRERQRELRRLEIKLTQVAMRLNTQSIDSAIINSYQKK